MRTAERFSGWLLLGAASAVLAEVPSMSAPFPLLNPWGLLVVLPLYTLHVLVLGGLAVRLHDPLSRSVLWLAGMLFGLYEAYLTKVVWEPTFSVSELPWRVGGVAVVQASVLVFLWHPLMSFLAPLLVIETSLTRSHETADAVRLKRRGSTAKHRPDPGRSGRWRSGRWRSGRWWRGPVSLGGGCGLYQAVIRPDPLFTAVTVLGGVLPIALGLAWWLRRSGPLERLRELLPSGRHLAWLAVPLAALYLVAAATLRPQSLPREATPHLIVLSCYAVIAIGLWRAGRQPSPGPTTVALGGSEPTPRLVLRKAGVLGLAWIAASAIGSVANGPVVALILLGWLIGVGGGLVVLARAVLLGR